MSHTSNHLSRRTFMGISVAGVTGLAITPVMAQEGDMKAAATVTAGGSPSRIWHPLEVWFRPRMGNLIG